MTNAAKPLDQLTEADVQGLVAESIEEGRRVEYKATLPDKSDKDQVEFATDVASLANAAGGRIFYGVEAKDGVPRAVTGITSSTVEGEILRLEQMMRAGIRPHLPGWQFKPIALASGNVVIALEIPRSWARPHAVIPRGTDGVMRFYARGEKGKHPLDIDELRAAFLGSSMVAEQMRVFRRDRLVSIGTGDELPVVLAATAKVVLHVLPESAFELGAAVDLTSAARDTGLLAPSTRVQGTNERWDLDGLVSWEPNEALGSYGYLEAFHTGAVEVVNADLLRVGHDGSRSLYAILVEEEVLAMLDRILRLQTSLSVQPPFVVMLSLLGVKDYTIEVSSPLTRRIERITRNELLLPEVLVEDPTGDLARLMKPVFDRMWNAAGFPGSLGYDEKGVRKPPK